MPKEPMTLLERLRNPRYARNPGEPLRLDVEGTVADMEEAARLIEALQKAPEK